MKKATKPLFSRELKSLPDRSKTREPFITISFRHVDPNQGQSFEVWEEEKLLALAVSKLKGLCQCTVIQAQAQGLIKIYPKNTWPNESEFTPPKHVQPEKWASMHVQGKPCLIGFFEDNILHIVFLDKEHRFWITGKKNT